MKISPKLRAWAERRHGRRITNDLDLQRRVALDVLSGELNPKVFAFLTGAGTNPKGRKAMSVAKKTVAPADGPAARTDININVNNPQDPPAPRPKQVFARTNKGGSLSTKRAPVLTKAGTPFRFAGKAVEAPSEQDYAVIGAWFKYKLRGFLGQTEQRVLLESFDRDEWTWDKDGISGVRVPASELKYMLQTKALLDDTVSGGIYVVPMILDDAIVTYPLLNGQLAPYVDVEDVSGRRIVTPTLQNPTMTWGMAEGSAIQPFNTSQIIGDLNSAVFPLVGAIELGRDFLEDTPMPNLGAKLTELFSQRVQEQLDYVIALGDGVTQPAGIMGTSGTVAVNSDNGAGGPPTVSDIERLLFAVPKQYRETPNANLAFLMNDTSYQRVRSIPVGQGDERRVFGMDHEAYTLFDNPVRISNGLTNNKLACLPLKKYRLFRRKGLEVRTETAGRQLALTNTMLIVVRARFGGRVIDPNAVATMSDFQS